MKLKTIKYTAIAFFLFANPSVGADSQDIAKKLANPLSSIISIPIQANYQPNLGVNGEGSGWITNLQPIVPLPLNDEWMLMTRTVIPIVSQDTGIPAVGRISGISDILFTAWAVPKEKTENGWLWGLGAALLLPSGTDTSKEKWGAGPRSLSD